MSSMKTSPFVSGPRHGAAPCRGGPRCSTSSRRSGSAPCPYSPGGGGGGGVLALGNNVRQAGQKST